MLRPLSGSTGRERQAKQTRIMSVVQEPPGFSHGETQVSQDGCEAVKINGWRIVPQAEYAVLEKYL